MAERKETYIGNSKLKDSPEKPIKIVIGENVVKSKHIADGAVTKGKLGNRSVEVKNLDDDVQNLIASMEKGGVALSGEFGDSELIGINQKKLTEEIGPEGTITQKVAALEEAVGEGGSIDERIATAKSELVDGASEGGDTFKKIEDRLSDVEESVGEGGSVDERIAVETNRAQAAEELLREYISLSQNQVAPKTAEEWAAMTSWEEGVIYRVAGTTSYTDYMYNGTTTIPMATYNNAIDNEPTAGSDNLVKSGGVYNSTPTVANSTTESDLDISDENGNILIRFANGHIQVKNFSSVDILDSIQAILSNIGFDNVPEFSEEEDYAIGDIVRYEKYVHVFTSAHTAGEWDNTEVEETVINTEHPVDVKTDNSTSDLDISDEDGNVLARFENGHIQTKNFNSADIDKVSKEVDLIIFMGQSNMAGRGISNETWPAIAPTIIENAAFEFRAVSDPTKLYPVAEPFGRNENRGGINDGTNKTGSLVTAFCNAYYEKSKKTIVAVSASKGGTSSSQWQPSGTLLPEAITRLNAAVSFLNQNSYTIKHKYMVWCQGETDGDQDVSPITYKANFDNIFSAMKSNGIEKCFIIRIGEINVSPYTKYDDIIQCQTDMCKDNEDYILVSTEFAAFRSKGLMKDQFHYFQEGYNRVGQHAGANAAEYRLYGKEPIIYDVKADNLYYSKNSY